MRKYAVVDNNIVSNVLDMTEEEYLNISNDHQIIIDITDLVIQPTVGWILEGNCLVPPVSSVTLNQIIQNRIKSYQDQAPALLRELYTQNTLLGITIQQSDQMFTDYQDVLIRIREGAWPTALYRLQQKTPSGFVTQVMIDNWVALIQSKMV